MERQAASLATRATFGVVAVALCVIFIAWTQDQWGGYEATRAFVDVASTVAAATAAMVAFRRARMLHPVRHLPWIFLGSGCAAWAAGNVAWTYYEVVAHQAVPFPSLADAGYLLLIPCIAAALLMLVVGVADVTSRVRMLLDGLFMASAFLFMARALLLRPLLDYVGQQPTTLAKVVALAYPLGDLGVGALLLLVLTRGNAALRRTLAWLALALAAITMADIGFWYLTATGQYTTGSPTDVGWFLGFLVVAYAGLRPIPPLQPSRAAAPGPVLAAVPLGPFIVATLVALWVEVNEGALEPFLFWNAIVVIALLVTRQFVMVLENQALRRDAEAAAADLAKARDERTAMLNSVTHDIMGPMSAIRLQVRLLRGADLPPNVRNSVAILERSTAQVTRMAQDLKDLANAEAGRLVLDVASLDLAQAARDAVATRQAAATEAGLSLAVEAPQATPALADVGRIHQVLDNLIGNAIRFTPSGGAIRVMVRPEGQGARVEVQDTGRGLAADELPRLFKPFSQVHDRTEVNERGTGLGLYNAQAIVRAHGGTIGVTSLGKGHGSTFWFTLPAPGPPSANAVTTSRPERTPAAATPPPPAASPSAAANDPPRPS